MTTSSRIRRTSVLENHPILVLLILLLWEPFSTSYELWESFKREIHHLWQVHYIVPQESACPREKTNHHVPFLSSTHSRPLTPPLSPPQRIGSLLNPHAKRQQTHLQDGSILFNRLPPELRVLVWKEVMGGYCAYPIDKQNWAYLQRKMIDRNTRHVAWSLSQPSPKLYHEGDGFVSRPCLLALPLTCRRIYHETITLLYSSNIFHFRSGSGLLSISPHPHQRISVGLSHPPNPIQSFAWRVLPHRFSTIRCLILQHSIFYAPIPSSFLQGWFALCQAVGELPSLRALRIELDPRPGLHHQIAVFGMGVGGQLVTEPRMPDSVYMPLLPIRHLDIFDVVVFCTEGEGLPVPSFGNVPFRLAIAQYPLPRLRRRRMSQAFHFLHGEKSLMDSEKWMRDALGMLRASSV